MKDGGEGHSSPKGGWWTSGVSEELFDFPLAIRGHSQRDSIIMDSLRPLFLAAAVSFFVLTASPSPVTAQDRPPGDDAAEVDPAQAEKEFMEFIESFGWKRDGAGNLKKWAEIEIPPGYRFTGDKGAIQMLETTGNIPSGDEAGIISPENFDWWVLFRFNDVGYVKDDEKDDIDPANLIRQKKEGQEAGNKERRKMGLDELYVKGWAKEPFYNEQTNNLEWAVLLEDQTGEQTVNYNSKLLGRSGFMDAVLVCDPEQLPAVLPEFQRLISGFHYKDGEKYAEYKSGDKIAKYGLTALIVGGGAAVAAKTGLLAWIGLMLAKGGKAVWAGIIAVFAGIWAGLRRLFGRGDD